ncbi:MAG TPA: hypothetical protein VGM27_03240 [Acidobacteriaceae bacterium]
MHRFSLTPRHCLRTSCLFVLLATVAAHGQQSGVPNQELIPGVPPATPVTGPLPGVNSFPIGLTPLAGRPYVFELEYRDPAHMMPEDLQVVDSLKPELAKEASLLTYDLRSPGWQYHQIMCPAFPDYLFLSFTHGPDPNGSSRFVAALERNGPRVRIVSRYSHGMLPFDSSWNRPATREVFNRIIRQERGDMPIGQAPNWLVIGMCYAELSGNHVQVLTVHPRPDATLDLLRLGANRPQLEIDSDRSADVTFSDASQPGKTTLWRLHFDRHGEITSAEHSNERQAPKIALKP